MKLLSLTVPAGNKLMLECVKAIREIDSTRWLYIGGNNYNSPDELKNLADIDDDYIVYNFHFYNPFFFTHQKAHWSESAMAYNRTVKYPGQYEGIEEFVKNNPKYSFMMELNNLKLNKEYANSGFFIPKAFCHNVAINSVLHHGFHTIRSCSTRSGRQPISLCLWLAL